MLPESPYRQTFSRKDNRLHLGYDYKDNILKRSTSNQMWGVSDVMDRFLTDLNSVVYRWVEAVKKIKVWSNPALDKHENRFN